MMDEPKIDDHQKAPEADGHGPNEPISSASSTEDTKTPPASQSSGKQGTQSEQQDTPLAWSKIPEAIIYWLHQYWAVPREKPKRSEIAMVLLTVAIAAAAFWSACIFQRQLNVAKDTLYAQTRPWVATGRIEIKNTAFLVYPHNPPQARTQFNFEISVPLKDTGNSPALNVEMSVGGGLTKEIGAFQSVQPMMDFECGQANNVATKAGTALFPNSFETPLGWETDLGTPFALPDDVHRVWIPICVRYDDTIDPKRIHHTKVWMVSWPINGRPKEIRRTITEPAIIYYSLPIGGWSVARVEAD